VNRKRFQFSLASLLIVVTGCALLSSMVKTFPITRFVLLFAGPALIWLGVIIACFPEAFMFSDVRFGPVLGALAGFLLFVAGVILLIVLTSVLV
jgi:hypothetical protein